MKYINYLKKYRLLGLFLLTITASVVYIIILNSNAGIIQSRLESVHEKSFNTLELNINNIDNNLDKLTAASSPEIQTEILMEIGRQTGEIESSAAALNAPYQTIYSFTELINTLGTDCKRLSKNIAGGRTLTEDDIAGLQTLVKSSDGIKTQIIRIRDNEDDTYLSDREIQDSMNTEQQAARITPQQAEEILKKFMGYNKANNITRKDDVLGNPECYSFEGNSIYGEFYAMVTKSGGKIRYFYINTKSTVSAIPSYDRYEKLKTHAENFLLQHFDMQFSAADAGFYGGCAVIELTPITSGIALYTDTIKVWMDISKDEIVGMDSYNFLVNNRNRYIPKPKITQEAAQEKLNANFNVESCRLALISIDAEVLCYEFSGSISGDPFLVYINAENGREEKILKRSLTKDGIPVRYS